MGPSHQSRMLHQINLLVLQIFSSSTSNDLKFCTLKLCTLDLLTRASPAQPASTSLSWKDICPFAKTRPPAWLVLAFLPIISNTELSTMSASSIPQEIVLNFGGGRVWGDGWQYQREVDRTVHIMHVKATFKKCHLNEGNSKMEGKAQWFQRKRQAPHALTTHMKYKHIRRNSDVLAQQGKPTICR